jgi:glycerol-3-phosphate dehydrogenase
MVVLACGPWLGSVVGLLRHKQVRPFIRFAKAINIVTRSIFESCAVGLCGQSAPSERRSVIRRRRLLFITPWHDHSLIGTAYASCDAGADDVRATRADIERFVAEINAACPAHKLQPDDVRFVHVGLVPMSNDRRSSGLQLAKHYQIRDHREEGMAGLMSVMGVKYTTARDVAEKVVDHVFRSRDRRPPKSVSAITPVHGGDIHDPAHFLAAESAKKIPGLGRDALRHLIDNYGSAYPEVLNHFGAHRSHGGPGDDFALLRAEVLHGIRVEMAQTLRDVVFRRTDLGTAGHPGKEALGVCAHIMAEELGWTPARMQQERASVTSVFTAWQ